MKHKSADVESPNKLIGEFLLPDVSNYILLKKLVPLITKNEMIQSQVVKTLYRKINEHCSRQTQYQI